MTALFHGGWSVRRTLFLLEHRTEAKKWLPSPQRSSRSSFFYLESRLSGEECMDPTGTVSTEEWDLTVIVPMVEWVHTDMDLTGVWDPTGTTDHMEEECTVDMAEECTVGTEVMDPMDTEEWAEEASREP